MKFNRDISEYVPDAVLEELKMKKKTRWPIYLIIRFVLTFHSFTVPLPYYIEVPGTSEDIRTYFASK